MNFINSYLLNRPYICKLCPVKYYRKYQLVKHTATKHPNSYVENDTNELSHESDEFSSELD